MYAYPYILNQLPTDLSLDRNEVINDLITSKEDILFESFKQQLNAELTPALAEELAIELFKTSNDFDFGQEYDIDEEENELFLLMHNTTKTPDRRLSSGLSVSPSTSRQCFFTPPYSSTPAQQSDEDITNIRANMLARNIAEDIFLPPNGRGSDNL